MGHEKADLLAKQADQTPFTGLESALRLGLTTVRDTAMNNENWHWQALPSCRQSTEMLRRPQTNMHWLYLGKKLLI